MVNKQWGVMVGASVTYDLTKWAKRGL
jgi:hypothetical protein